MAVESIPEALSTLSRAATEHERHPVLHGASGTLLTIGLANADGTPEWVGVWIEGSTVRFLGRPTLPPRGSVAAGLQGNAATLVDILGEALRRASEAAGDCDARLAELEASGGSAVPTKRVWALQREAARLRGLIGRLGVVLGELSGPFLGDFPGLEKVVPSLQRQIERNRELVLSLQQSLSDLILLRNAEESNRIAESANRLSVFSNRIAVLTNVSNIRMLGITYIALLLGLVSAAVLIPNTAATILGMPSAAWVPGLWVDVSLILLGVVPVLLIFSRPWVVRLLKEIGSSELRTGEGLADLPEIPAPEEPR